MIMLSIVIPYYNDHYILDCINSIYHQIDSNDEIIIVNDGSSEYYSSLLDRSILNKENISIYHQCNSGLSKSRNRGVNLSSNDYIVFVDSDDMLIDNAIDIIKSHVINADCLFYSSLVMNEEGVVLEDDRYVRDSVIDIYKQNKHIVNAVLMCIKKSVIIDNNIRFKIMIYEDNLYYIDILNNIKSHVIIKEQLYKRRIRSQSIMTSPVNTYKIYSMVVLIIGLLYKLSLNINDISRKTIKSILFEQIKYLIKLMCRL